MTVRIDLNISLDGVAMPANQSPENPMGEDWGRLVAAYVATKTMRARVGAPIDFDNGTRFEFLAVSAHEALARARELANGADIRIGGGASVAREFLAAGLVDRLHVAISPIVLGRGVRLWDDLRQFENDYTVASEVAESGVIHVTFSREGAT